MAAALASRLNGSRLRMSAASGLAILSVLLSMAALAQQSAETKHRTVARISVHGQLEGNLEGDSPDREVLPAARV